MQINAFADELEAKRLQALLEYDVLDSGPEESFDRVTRLVTNIVGCRSSKISLVDSDRQWFKSNHMCSVTQTPRNISFCTHTIEQSEPLIVRDATRDPRFQNSPLVTGPDPVSFYAGVPLRTPKGYNIGALCATDSKPRDISPAQLSAMHDLAGVVIDLLELRRLATVDGLTGALTCRAFKKEKENTFKSFKRYGPNMTCVMLDLDHFKQVNDQHGHAVGDAVLREVGKVVAERVRDIDIFGRVGGEEFALVVKDDLDGALRLAEELRACIADTKIDIGGFLLSVTASFGVSAASLSDITGRQVMARSDRALYQAKREGRNRVISALDLDDEDLMDDNINLIAS